MLQFENQKIKQIVRKVLPVVTLGAMLYSCASIGRPDGGPYDETPPRFIGSTPAAGALNNERTKISLMFDEFIKLEKATEKVVVSPPQIQQPEIKLLHCQTRVRGGKHRTAKEHLPLFLPGIDSQWNRTV